MAAVDDAPPVKEDGPPSVASTLSDTPVQKQGEEEEPPLKKPEQAPTPEELARAKMARCISALCACAAAVSLVLLVIGVSTSSWLTFNTSGTSVNPVRVNKKFAAAESGVSGAEAGVDSTTTIEYAVAYYGLWNACYREKKGASSCSLANLRCTSSVCWNRKTSSDGSNKAARACKKSKVAPLKIKGKSNCLWYQISRLAAGVALLFAVFGTSANVVSTCTGNKPVGMLGGIMTFFSGVAGCALFVFVYLMIFLNTAGNNKNIFMGWSFWMVIISWPIAILAGLAACCNASLSGPHREISDYPADN